MFLKIPIIECNRRGSILEQGMRHLVQIGKIELHGIVMKFKVIRYKKKQSRNYYHIRYRFKTTFLTKDMFLSFILAEVIFRIPVWIPALISVLGIYNLRSVVGLVLLFWAGPFTPAIPLQIGFAFIVKKVFTFIKRKVSKKYGRTRKRKSSK